MSWGGCAVAPGGRVQGSAKWAAGGKINLEKVNFLRSQYFKLLSHIKEDPINKGRCLKIITSVRVAIVTARPGRQKLATPLVRVFLNGRGCWVLALNWVFLKGRRAC
jgi:hypothetical protein